MNTDLIAVAAATRSPVETLAHRLADRLAEELEDGAHPVTLAEAALIAFLPLALEVTRAGTIEDCLLSLAARFDGNAVRVAN